MLRITSILAEKTHNHPKPKESLKVGISETKSTRFTSRTEEAGRTFQKPADQDTEESRPVGTTFETP